MSIDVAARGINVVPGHHFSASLGDESPEDQLWRAAAAVTEIQDALDELRAGGG